MRYSESLAIPYEFENALSHYWKKEKCHWGFERVCIESVDCFGNNLNNINDN